MDKVVWTKLASGQFERAIKYIRNEHGLYYAKIVLNKVFDTVSLLEQFPEMGAIEPLLVHKKNAYRFLVVFSYKVIYKTVLDKVIVVRFFHTYQKPSKLHKRIS